MDGLPSFLLLPHQRLRVPTVGLLPSTRLVTTTACRLVLTRIAPSTMSVQRFIQPPTTTAHAASRWRRHKRRRTTRCWDFDVRSTRGTRLLVERRLLVGLLYLAASTTRD